MEESPHPLCLAHSHVFVSVFEGTNLPKLDLIMIAKGTEYGKADYRWLYGDPNIVGLEM